MKFSDVCEESQQSSPKVLEDLIKDDTLEQQKHSLILIDSSDTLILTNNSFTDLLVTSSLITVSSPSSQFDGNIFS